MAPFTGQQGAVPKLKLTCLGVTVEINKSHYDKLRLLYARTAGPAAHDATAFTHAAMALLLRYSSLQGTHYRGGGFQVRRSHPSPPQATSLAWLGLAAAQQPHARAPSLHSEFSDPIAHTETPSILYCTAATARACV